MGEIVDLESYRKRRKRKAQEARTAAVRRHGERPRATRERSQPAVEPSDPNRAEPTPPSDLDRDDRSSD